jgi:hypothetical protein
MKARGLRHLESVKLLYLDIACIILTEIIAYDFTDVHEGIIQLVSTMYLSLILKSFFIKILHKVVDSFIVVNKEVILKLSLKLHWEDYFFFDNNFS